MNTQNLHSSAKAFPTGHQAKISRGIYIRPILFALACMMIMPLGRESGLGPVFGFFLLIFIFPCFLARCWVQRKAHRYTVNESGLRISIRMWALLKSYNGFLSHKKIESVSVEQGLLGRLFRYGHIVITASGGASTTLKYVSSPNDFAQRFEIFSQSLDQLPGTTG